MVGILVIEGYLRPYTLANVQLPRQKAANTSLQAKQYIQLYKYLIIHNKTLKNIAHYTTHLSAFAPCAETL